MKQTVEKNNKGKIWFFENINKIEKPLTRMITREKTKNHTNMVWGKLCHPPCLSRCAPKCPCHRPLCRTATLRPGVPALLGLVYTDPHLTPGALVEVYLMNWKTPPSPT